MKVILLFTELCSDCNLNSIVIMQFPSSNEKQELIALTKYVYESAQFSYTAEQSHSTLLHVCLFHNSVIINVPQSLTSDRFSTETTLLLITHPLVNYTLSVSM